MMGAYINVQIGFVGQGHYGRISRSNSSTLHKQKLPIESTKTKSQNKHRHHMYTVGVNSRDTYVIVNIGQMSFLSQIAGYGMFV